MRECAIVRVVSEEIRGWLMVTNAGIVRDSKIETTGTKHECEDVASKSIASAQSEVRRLHR
jgi:hypothetical protein